MRNRFIAGFVIALTLAVSAAVVVIAADGGKPDKAKEQKRPSNWIEPQTPQQTLAQLELPKGFKATLFAGEPDVVQPLSFTIDPRGRLWVIECLSYPHWDPDGGHDRVSIYEDADGDGVFDTRKVFLDNGRNLSSIAVGFGGVWLCSTPEFVFVPDADGDDKPDGPPRVLLDGFAWQKVKHNVFTGLTWGPDGWLYGGHGILETSHIGKPGTPDDQRVEMNCGVWRYHPTRHVFEVVAHGMTNPWGLDFDDRGQLFATNCVISHVFHIVPGGRYARMYGEHFNKFTYDVMTSPADHLHWAGAKWQESRGNTPEQDKLGGGHAHAGCMFYLGDNWPDDYRDTMFVCNVHGLRINNDAHARKGSGYVVTHRPDFARDADPWFRGLELKCGPDGGVYVTDWYDYGECHDYDYTHRTSGRIYKITYGEAKPVKVDLAKQSNDELVAQHLNANEWYVRTARRILEERAARGDDMAAVHAGLRKITDTHADVSRRLRAMWTLHATGGLSDADLVTLMSDKAEDVRAWAVRLATDSGAASDAAIAKFVQLASGDESGLVLLHVASALNRLPVDKRWALAEQLVKLTPEQADHNLTLLIWYGVEPLVGVDKARALKMVATTKLPILRQYLARRAAS
ncbi:MAG: hypothetical protein GC159_18465 [Phycisphaera sp.]|nr:hypothetical protein [Phycisphaera sp.]